MRVALFSFLHSYNYGTILQSYALLQALKIRGIDSEYIDYVPYIESSGIRKYLGKVKNYLYSIVKRKRHPRGIDDFSFWSKKAFSSVKNRCDVFVKEHIMISEKYNPTNICKINKNYDLFIVGSDQTWSPHIVKEDSCFFLPFISDINKKVSYAPSLGTTHIPEYFKTTLKRRLGAFKSLSCRERTNCIYLSSLLNRDVNYVIDPTLLLNKEEWMSVSSSYTKLPARYVLCYILGEKKCISDFAENLGHKMSLPVLYIMTRPYYLSKSNVITDAGPAEFLTILSKASCLVTDSFHGTIFSINFSVPFYSFAKRNEGEQDNDRIMEILNEFKLNNRFCSDDVICEGFKDIDFKYSQSHLKYLRNQSIGYLERVLYEL